MRKKYAGWVGVLVLLMMGMQCPSIPTDTLAIASVRLHHEGGKVGDPHALSGPFFDALIARHDDARDDFLEWRRLVSRHAADLACFVKSFPGTEAFSVDELRRVLQSQTGLAEPVIQQDLFAPWTNRWSGSWSNGTSQYHIWGPTYRREGRWLQPVAQSEVHFPDLRRLGAMLRANEADLAINVFSEETGISGWVSKRQHGRLEIPCIGYLLDETTLLWVAQEQEPEHLFAPNPQWLIFLEKVDTLTAPRQYQIYGRSVVIDHGIVWDDLVWQEHTGHYVEKPESDLRMGKLFD